MREDRSWMYEQFLSDNSLNPDFLSGIDYFVTEALKHSDTDRIRCPCRECDNGKFFTGDEVRGHLFIKGFTLFYTCWHRHGEERVVGGSNRVPVNECLEEMNRMNEMVVDVAGPDFNWDREDEVPNDQAKKFYEMLEAADKPVWELDVKEMNLIKCKESLLSYVSKLLNLKSEFQLPRECFDRMISIIKSGFPETENNKLPSNFYEAKKLTSALGLKYKKIDLKYRWGRRQKFEKCAEVFNTIATSRDNNSLTRIRKRVAEEVKSEDPLKWKVFTPDWCDRLSWEGMCDKWNTEEWQNKSKQAKENRLKSGVRVFHRHGSVNAHTTRSNMEHKLGRPVTFHEVFVETHSKKGNRDEWLTVKAGKTMEDYKKFMTEKYGPDENLWPFDDQGWAKLSGGKKHGRFYGVPAILNSDKLKIRRKSKFPVLDNDGLSINSKEVGQSSASSGIRGGAFYFPCDYYSGDDDDDVDYVPGDDEIDEENNSNVIFSENEFDQDDYEEADLESESDASSSDDEVFCSSGGDN